MRVKRGTIRARKRSRLLNRAKGFRWGRKNIPRLAKVAVLKAGVHAYRDRRRKRRDFHQLWNIQINAAARANGTKYSQLQDHLKRSKITLNRKMLAELAENHPKVFAVVVAQSQK
ncbi:MAG: 50S ribosomal protein L20 [Parcubacteria group bacterium]